MRVNKIDYNESHIKKIQNGIIISFVEKSQFSSVTLFKSFEHTDLDMNKYIAIVTYKGLTNYLNIYQAVWDGKSGIDYFLFTNSNEAIDKMNELANSYKCN